jgi:hypothetical protein
VLTPPEREGREALFGFRQIVEFLAARYLLKDGWPLVKIGEIVRASDIPGLAQLIPSDKPRTLAEEVVSKYSSGRAAASAPAARSRLAKKPSGTEWHTLAASTAPHYRAADISRRRVSLAENLKSLGNAGGLAIRSPIVRIELTPWCHVQVDAHELTRMSEDTASVLGAALTQALLDERTQKR